MTGQAFRCHFAPEHCTDVTRWRLDRVGDAIVSWACDRHLTAVVEDLQRPRERTEVVVKPARFGVPATPPAVPSEECPIYRARADVPDAAFAQWLVECDEGWRSTIVASGMYHWAALWLVVQLQGKPFAPGVRP